MDAVLGVVILAITLFVVITLIRSVRVVPQQRMDVVERLGRYHRTLSPGLNLLVPFIDAVRSKVDMREQVVSFPPQPVITSDNLVVSIDTVLYFKVVDSVRATYEIANFLQAIEQLTVTTLRNVIGSLDLEKALTSRDQINRHLSAVLDETTGRWGIKVTRVEIKAIEPPPSIRDSMEKQMRAERDRRAAILTAEGVKQSKILTAEGEKQAAVLRAEGDRQSRILQAEGQGKAIKTVFDAIHEANPSTSALAYQYLQALPQIANGQANKIWVIPAELTRALDGINGALGGFGSAAGAGAAERPSREPTTVGAAPVAGPPVQSGSVQSGPARSEPARSEPVGVELVKNDPPTLDLGESESSAVEAPSAAPAPVAGPTPSAAPAPAAGPALSAEQHTNGPNAPAGDDRNSVEDTRRLDQIIKEVQLREQAH